MQKLQQIQILDVASDPFGTEEESDKFFDKLDALELQWLNNRSQTKFFIKLIDSSFHKK